jgi:hypothetical protein
MVVLERDGLKRESRFFLNFFKLLRFFSSFFSTFYDGSITLSNHSCETR